MRARAAMLQASSGRHGFDKIEWSGLALDKPPKELLKRMLGRERELRLSDETQRWFDEHKLQNLEPFYLQLQQRVATEFGFTEPNEQEWVVRALRSAATLYPDDLEILDIPLYLKHNLSGNGDLKVGDTIPADIPLVSPDTRKKSELVALNCKDRPLVVIAGSAT